MLLPLILELFVDVIWNQNPGSDLSKCRQSSQGLGHGSVDSLIMKDPDADHLADHVIGHDVIAMAIYMGVWPSIADSKSKYTM